MAVDYPFTTEAQIRSIVGQLGIDLRTDDSADYGEDIEDVIDQATGEIYFYLGRYSLAAIASNNWAQWHAAWFAVRCLCQRRLNDVPATVESEWARREKQLTRVLDRKVPAPGLATSRRPAVVTNYTVDLRRFNNQIRVDRTKSTGVAKDYLRPTDESAPDNR